MVIIKDAMILIHLAKTTLLETSCDYFRNVFIPEQVKQEVITGKFPEERIIHEMIDKNKIKVKKLENKEYLKKAHEFNIQRGEAEAVALYWETKADLLATDDDSVRKKRELLRINMIGTPAMILQLYKKNKIKKEKLIEVVRTMRRIGWFGNTVWDKVMIEADKHE